MEALLGVVIGSVVAIGSTLTIEVYKQRRELRHRWDEPSLQAIIDFVEAVNRAIGALYDEGRSRCVRGSHDEETIRLDRVSRTALDTVRVAHVRARLLRSSMDASLKGYLNALYELKQLADEGFPGDDAKWKAAQRALQDQLDRFIVDVAASLRINSD